MRQKKDVTVENSSIFGGPARDFPKGSLLVNRQDFPFHLGVVHVEHQAPCLAVLFHVERLCTLARLKRTLIRIGPDVIESISRPRTGMRSFRDAEHAAKPPYCILDEFAGVVPLDRGGVNAISKILLGDIVPALEMLQSAKARVILLRPA